MILVNSTAPNILCYAVGPRSAVVDTADELLTGLISDHCFVIGRTVQVRLLSSLFSAL